MRKQVQIDLLALVVLIALNPVIYSLGETRGYFSPDAVKYMTFARDFLSSGLLFFEGGASDSGNILPPLYPTFLLIGNAFTEDSLFVPGWVSRFAAIATSFVFYGIARNWCSQFFAFVIALTIQTNYEFVLWALTPLTEATFIFFVACVLWLTIYVLSARKKAVFLVLLGFFLSVVFLTRQVGLLLPPFILLVVLIDSHRRFLRNAIAITIGMSILILPYMAALYYQGNSIQADLSAFDQNWSSREIIPIEELNGDVQDYLRWLDNAPTNDYNDLIYKRRLMSQLLPDGSAMLSDVDLGGVSGQKGGVGTVIGRVWQSLDQYPRRVLTNCKHLIDSLGLIVCSVFTLLLLTPIWTRGARKTVLARYLVGGFVVYFLLAMSLLTDQIGRYVSILVPFMLFYVSIETFYLLHKLRKKLGTGIAALGIYSMVLAGYSYSQPMDVRDIELISKSDFVSSIGAREFRRLVKTGDPIFSTFPFQAYAAGGSWRILPNDSLEKIAIFASRENVRWLLVVRELRSEIVINANSAKWYMDPNLDRRYPQLLELMATSRDEKAKLFRFRNGDPGLEE